MRRSDSSKTTRTATRNTQAVAPQLLPAILDVRHHSAAVPVVAVATEAAAAIVVVVAAALASVVAGLPALHLRPGARTALSSSQARSSLNPTLVVGPHASPIPGPQSSTPWDLSRL